MTNKGSLPEGIGRSTLCSRSLRQFLYTKRPATQSRRRHFDLPVLAAAQKSSGPTISVALPASLLPSQGFDFADYGYNLLPRFAPDGVDPGDNTQISDFAPDASIFPARPQGTPGEPQAVDWDALAAQVQANFAATGQWFAPDGPRLPEPVTDWDALAAQVQANFAATGTWYL